MRKLILVAFALLLIPSTGFGQIIINEVDYDQPGSPDTDEFVEIFNNSAGPVTLSDYDLEFIDGASGTVYRTVTLSGSLTAGSHYVICSNVDVSPCDLNTGFGDDWIQNGAPDAIALVNNTTSTIVDAVSYEGDVVGYVETAGAPGDPFTGVGQGLSRSPTSDDTDDNSADFTVRCISAGASNLLTTTGCTPLPVELGEIKTTVDDGDVVIEWTTLSEQKVASFEIQQKDALGFVAIGSVEAANQPNTYTHRVTDLGPGVYTFRLRMIDLDGSFAYSPEVETSIEVTSSYAISRAYPNPFATSSSFAVTAERDQNVTVRLFDVLGRQIDVLYEGTLQAGRTQEITTDGSSLTNGTYFVRITGDYFDSTQTLIRMK